MHEPPGNQPALWPTTHWTLIDLMANGRSKPPSQDEVGSFLEDYLGPLKAYLIRRRGLAVHDAEDVLQEFILQRFLSQELTRHVDQQRGRFRTFLLTSLDHFLSNQTRRDRAQKRSPANGVGSLEQEGAPPQANQPAADDLYEIEWARMIVRQAIEQVRDYCVQTDRPEIWEVFDARVVRPILDRVQPESNARLAERLGMQSPQQVSNALVTAKRIYKRALHGVVVKYARSDAEVDAELAELREILARHSA